MDDYSNPSFLISVPYRELPLSSETRFDNWVCSVSQTLSDDLDLTVQCLQEQPVDRHCCYSRVCIYADPTCDPSSLLLEMPIRASSMLLQGLRDPAMVRFYDRYIFHVIIFRDKVDVLSREPKQRQGRRHISVSMQSDHRWIRPSLRTSQVSSKARQRLTEFLERATNADVQLSFSPRACLGVRVAEEGSRGFEPTHVLHAHSCILKTVGSPAMARLLNTLSPTDNTGRHTGNNNNDADSRDEGSSSRKIREIRFEDSPPAAVEAVVRYIYLGQKPAIEPFCGYTVKDLVLLSTYLEIVCLQNHCVDLVLGRFRDFGEDANPPILLCDGAGDLSWTAHVKHSHHPSYPHASRWRGPLSHIPADGLAQVLFDWGYRFPRIRFAIIQALVFDYGYMFADPGAVDVWLDRFSGHEAYSAILCQLVEEQLALVYHNSAPFSRPNFG